MAEILVPVSIGELVDKITILEIKAERIRDAAKLANVAAELAALRRTWAASGLDEAAVAQPWADLKAVNLRLWDIEDRIRDKEREAAFDAEFIALARAVYFENDDRARFKREINQALGSAYVEEKSYASYQRGAERPQV